jgi:large subunit ribosomal protein L22
LVADVVRGKDVNQAIRSLTFMKQKGAGLIKKLIESAVANAEHKKTIDVDNLYVKSIWVDMGPSMKRFRPRAQGRAFTVRKKMSHINVVLDEK